MMFTLKSAMKTAIVSGSLLAAGCASTPPYQQVPPVQTAPRPQPPFKFDPRSAEEIECNPSKPIDACIQSIWDMATNSNRTLIASYETPAGVKTAIVHPNAKGITVITKSGTPAEKFFVTNGIVLYAPAR